MTGAQGGDGDNGGQQRATSTQNAEEAMAEERPAASDGDTIEMRGAGPALARVSSWAGAPPQDLAVMHNLSMNFAR
jgi:hypothetical protein